MRKSELADILPVGTPSVRNLRFFSHLLSDGSLTKKASLNAVASGLDYGARLVVGFLIQPLMVAGLGDFFYGTWQVLLRLVGSISPASGRATQALKFTLANRQTSANYEEKRRYVGSAIAVWVFFLPILMTLGGTLTWFAPFWIKAPVEYYWPIRLAAGLLVLHLVMTTLISVPQSVLEGENLGYKRMGLSAVLVFFGGGFTWLALYLDTGITGVAVATLATTLLTGFFFLYVVRTFAPWFGVARPTMREVRQFLGLSWWFLAWNLLMNLMMAADVTVLGMLNTVESVTTYTLTKYAPETLITIIAIMAFGISPGLGGIIGSGNLKKAAQIRGEIMALTWLVLTVLGTTVLLWNRVFIGLWVGEEHYAGTIPSLLIVLLVMQLILIRNDGNIIDLTLRLRNKVIMGVVAVSFSLVAAGVSVGYFRLGISGLCFGLIIGRTILSVGYPVLVGRLLNISFSSQIRGILRPVSVTILLFSAATGLDSLVFAKRWLGVSGWMGLMISVGATFGVVQLFAFYAGLSSCQRRGIFQRVRAVLAPSLG
jgi:O-antigen/teichoic acid export membrane protein